MCRNTDNETALVQSISIEGRERYEKLLSQKQLEVSSIRTEWRDEAYQLRRENKQLKEKREDLLEKIRLLENVLAKRGAVGDPWEYEFYLKNKAIYELEKKITSMQTQMRFITDGSNLSSGISIDAAPMITSTMEFLQAELDSILHGHDTLRPLHLPETIQSNDLSTLIRSVHPSEGVKSEHWLLRRWVLQSDPDMVIKVLVLAALREWVFMSPFPNFVGDNTLLLDAYRRALMSQGMIDMVSSCDGANTPSDGWRNVHNLEVTAYCSLVDNDDLQDITIPAKAEEYANRLSSALAVLFPNDGQSQQPHVESPHFETWG